MSGWAALVAGLVVALSCVLVSPVLASSSEERIAAANRAKVSAIRAELENARAARERKAAALQDAQQRFAVVMQAVGAAELAVERQQEAVEKARADLSALETRAVRQRQLVAARATKLYKQGTTGNITVLLDAVNPVDALRRSEYVDVIGRTERRVMETVTVARTAVNVQRRKLDSEEASLRRVVAEQRALLAEVEAIRKNRAMALVIADQQVAELEDHLEAEEREIAAITRGSSSSTLTPVTARGGWIWPARGPITSGFGMRWGRMHKGIDIGAPTGTPILAAKAGVVSYAGVMSGYGRVVIIDHGGGLSTLYAHQSAIAVSRGQHVAQGQRVGSVGCTGHCTGPHLHFEVRINGAARNPRGFL
jgi:murein DD-endopeptidase MepM/ murein hydrolase activator NlpD